MGDTFAIWTPEYYGHKPPLWENGMVWRYRTTLQTEWQREMTGEPAWVTAGSYQVPALAVDAPAFDYPTWAAQGRANADKLPDGVAEALGPERDWAHEVAAAWWESDADETMENLAHLIRRLCRPIGNDTVTDEWLREVREATNGIAYFINNPSAWEGYDDTVSDGLREYVTRIRNALGATQ